MGATELRLEGARIKKVQYDDTGKILVEVLAKWQGQIPEEYSQVKPGTLEALRLGTEEDGCELRVGRVGDLKAMDSKKRVKIVCYAPGLLGEPDSRCDRLRQWMLAQVDHEMWEVAPPNSRGKEPLVPAVEWIYRAAQGELFETAN